MFNNVSPGNHWRNILDCNCNCLCFITLNIDFSFALKYLCNDSYIRLIEASKSKSFVFSDNKNVALAFTVSSRIYHPFTAAIVHRGTWTNGKQRISVHDDV